MRSVELVLTIGSVGIAGMILMLACYRALVAWFEIDSFLLALPYG